MNHDALIDIVHEFLECSVHCILKIRAIYPPELFEKRMKYGVSTWFCRHPDICQYINRVLGNVKPFIKLVGALHIFTIHHVEITIAGFTYGLLAE